MEPDVALLRDFLFSSSVLLNQPERTTMTDLSGNVLYPEASPVHMHRVGQERLHQHVCGDFSSLSSITTFLPMCEDDERKKKACADDKPIAEDDRTNEPDEESNE
jgi:hypothetical protein